jgi:hypothetical protein
LAGAAGSGLGVGVPTGDVAGGVGCCTAGVNAGR